MLRNEKVKSDWWKRHILVSLYETNKNPRWKNKFSKDLPFKNDPENSFFGMEITFLITLKSGAEKLRSWWFSRHPYHHILLLSYVISHRWHMTYDINGRLRPLLAMTYNIWAILTSYYIYMLLRVFKGVFGDALISRRLKLDSWNFRFRKLRVLGAYDLKGSKLHMV